MPTLIDYFSNLIARLRPAQAKTTSSEAASTSRPTGLGRLGLAVERDRRAVVKECREMYALDTRVEGLITALARDAVKGGFTVTVNAAPDVEAAQAAAETLIQRVKLFSRLDDWVRLTLRDGDSFLELAVEKSGAIAQVTRKPTLSMHRNCNDFDYFDDPRRAYWYSDQPWLASIPPADALWLADWQIIHARWGHDEGNRYGQPLFASARTAWRRLTEGEKDIAVRRKTRAGMKYVHKIEGGEEEIEQYRQTNRDTLDNPLAAIQDFFGNVDISAIQGDAQLNQIEDVLHHLDTFAFASPVPLELIGYGKRLNRDILEQKLEQYERMLEPVTQWVTDQLVRPLLETQWLLLGVWPGGLDYSLSWASKKTLTATMLKDAADAGLKLQALGWPAEMVVEVMTPFLPGLNPAKLLELLAAAQANQPDEIGRIAAGAAR